MFELLLLDSIINSLSSERIFQFHCQDWQTIEKDSNVNGVLVLGGIFQLPYDGKSVGLLELQMFWIHS